MSLSIIFFEEQAGDLENNEGYFVGRMVFNIPTFVVNYCYNKHYEGLQCTIAPENLGPLLLWATDFARNPGSHPFIPIFFPKKTFQEAVQASKHSISFQETKDGVELVAPLYYSSQEKKDGVELAPLY